MDNLELARHIIEKLNEFLSLDPKAMGSLINYRTRANGALAGHPTVQVHDDPDNVVPSVGLLGIINGICGTFPGTFIGYITAVYDDSTQELLRFELSDPSRYQHSQ